jgi:hypothetical protein
MEDSGAVEITESESVTKEVSRGFEVTGQKEGEPVEILQITEVTAQEKKSCFEERRGTGALVKAKIVFGKKVASSCQILVILCKLAFVSPKFKKRLS